MFGNQTRGKIAKRMTTTWGWRFDHSLGHGSLSLLGGDFVILAMRLIDHPRTLALLMEEDNISPFISHASDSLLQTISIL